MQVDDLLDEIRNVAAQGLRTLVTMLTKRMAEDLTDYLHEQGIRVRYMHSDIDTIERIEILRDLRLGAFDVLVGINLLREGLDIPECGLVAILDADKEGFLRSETSPDPDHRPGGAQHRRPGDHVCRPHDRSAWNAPSAKPTAAAKSRWPTTPCTASRRKRSGRTSRMCCSGIWQGDTDRPRITAKVDKPMVGKNLAAHLDALRLPCARPPRTWSSKKPPACAMR